MSCCTEYNSNYKFHTIFPCGIYRLALCKFLQANHLHKPKGKL
jgi:hypothetical protein